MLFIISYFDSLLNVLGNGNREGGFFLSSQLFEFLGGVGSSHKPTNFCLIEVVLYHNFLPIENSRVSAVPLYLYQSQGPQMEHFELHSNFPPLQTCPDDLQQIRLSSRSPSRLCFLLVFLFVWDT